jgi:IS605 OrfB family transposase
LTAFPGEVPEWFNGAVSKTVVPKGTPGSNPGLSAMNRKAHGSARLRGACRGGASGIVEKHYSIPMSTKAIQAKVICDTWEHRYFLWITHKLFNDSVQFVIPKVNRMKRGELGDDFKLIYTKIRNNQDAIGKLEQITSLKAKSGKKEEWACAAERIRKSGNLLFDRKKELPGFSNEFRRKVFEMTIQKIHGHQELVDNWKKEHDDWLKEKEKFEKDHKDLMSLWPEVEKFEKEAGSLKGSKKRWYRYLEFLGTHPIFSTYRDGGPLSKEERSELKRPGEHFELFFKKNPKLVAIDSAIKKYCDLLRPWAKKRNSDGFKHRPTFTLPNPIVHPEWYTFKKNATYRKLDLQKGEVELKIIPSEDIDKRDPKKYINYRFEADPRIKNLIPSNIEKIGREKYDHHYFDPVLDKNRPAVIKGIKLIFKGLNRKRKLWAEYEREKNPDKKKQLLAQWVDKLRPYFVFTLALADEAKPVKLEWNKKEKHYVIPEKLVTMAIDVGQRDLGAVTIAREQDGVPVQIGFLPEYWKPLKSGNSSKPVKAWLVDIPGISFEALKKHEKEARGREKGARAKRVKGENYALNLREHISHMKEDRYKKAASILLRTAIKNKVQVIVLEKLKNLQMSLERPKKENVRLMNWAIRKVTDFLKEQAKPLGLLIKEVSPFGTSMLCSSCGYPGYRASLPSKSNWEKFYKKKYGEQRRWIPERGGKIFICSNPKCQRKNRMINADINASINLHKRLYDKLYIQTTRQKDKNGKTIFTTEFRDFTTPQMSQEIQSYLDTLPV